MLFEHNSGDTRASWQALIGTTIERDETTRDTITNYLATHFPERLDRNPTLVSGEASVTFRPRTAGDATGLKGYDPGSIWTA